MGYPSDVSCLLLKESDLRQFQLTWHLTKENTMSYTNVPSSLLDQSRSHLHGQAKRVTVFAFVWIALIAVFVAAPGMVSSGATASADSERVRFRGTMVNQSVSDGAFPISTSTLIGEVTATHVGKGQVSGTFTNDLSGLLIGECSELVEGVINFIAADGSALNMVVISSEICFEPSGEIVFTSEYDVVGGTGRFTGADGFISAVGSLDLATGTTMALLSGKIALHEDGDDDDDDDRRRGKRDRDHGDDDDHD